MNTPRPLEEQIRVILSTIEQPESTHSDIDTRSLLCNLARNSTWGKAELDDLNFLSKRLDISKKLHTAYLKNGRKAAEAELSDRSFQELTVALLLKATRLGKDELSPIIRMKRFNTLFKSLDITTPEWLAPGTELAKEMEASWQSLLANLPMSNDELKVASDLFREGNQTQQELTIIPITVLFYEGPIARAYLECIKSLGCQPQKIVELVAAKDVATKNPVGKWLPKSIRLLYAANIQRNKIHYWPKQLLKHNVNLVNGILSEVQAKLRFSRATIDRANRLLPLSSYSGCVEPLLIDGLNDKKLTQYLENQPAGAVLYTGGGIVPTALFEIKHLKYLHIHPGYLPDIRGADCALWSSLLMGHTSASCFYMSPGIDIGDIIHRCWLPEFSLDADIQGIEMKSIYRAIYAFLDPWVRSFLLRQLIDVDPMLVRLDSIPQSEEDGTTFHFMHKRLQQAAFERLFVR